MPNLNSKDGKRTDEQIRKDNEKYIKEVRREYRERMKPQEEYRKKIMRLLEEEEYGEKEKERKSYFANIWNAIMRKVK